MPKELGSCDFEPGSEGSIVHTLTNPLVVSYEVFKAARYVNTRQLQDITRHIHIYNISHTHIYILYIRTLYISYIYSIDTIWILDANSIGAI